MTDRPFLVVGCVLMLLLPVATTGVGAATASPSATFTYTPSTPNPNDTITFNASASSDTDGQIVDYDWYVGGGTYADGGGETFKHSFGEAGSYTITLEVEDDQGNVDQYATTVTVENPAPKAQITATTTSPAPDETVRFTASESSDADGRIVEYDWYVGTDDYSDGSGENFETSFDTAGTYTITLEVEDNGGKTDRVSKTITVDNTAPTAAFDADLENPNPDDTITFDASDSVDPDGQIVEYEWYVGTDGYEDGDGQSFTHAFDTAGVYTVRLVVTDNGNEAAVIEKDVNVTNPAPVPDFTTRSSPDGLEVTFDGSASSDADGWIDEYSWYIGSDGYEDGDEQTLTHTFDKKGEYDVQLVVTDNGGVTREVTKTVGVSVQPTAQIDYTGEAIPVNQTVTLSANNSVDPDGSITEYEWTLPDGTTKYGETVSTSVAATGEHTVNLTVTDDTGNTHTVSESLVAKTPPDVTVSWSPETPRNNLDVTFDVASSKPIDVVHWDFDGDGEYDDDTGQTAVHAYETTGKKQVGVQVIDADGVATQTTTVVPVQQSAAFDLHAVKSDMVAGDTAVVTFSTSNLVRDTPMDVKLSLDLPASGAAISSVDGASVAGASETEFITVDPGQESQIQVRIQFTEPNTYDVGGEAVFYFGEETGAAEDRRTTTVDPVTITATEKPEPDTEGLSVWPDEGLPKFTPPQIASGLLVGLTVWIVFRR